MSPKPLSWHNSKGKYSQKSSDSASQPTVSGYHGSSSHHYPSSKFGPHATPSTSDHGMGYHMPAPDIG